MSSVQVLATDRKGGIEYEYWLPPEQFALHHGRRSPLRQAHHAASYRPWEPPPPTATAATTRPHHRKISYTHSVVVLLL